MLTRAAIAAPTMAWQAVWDNISQSAHLICCATVLADYTKILLLFDYNQFSWLVYSAIFAKSVKPFRIYRKLIYLSFYLTLELVVKVTIF